MGPEEELLMRTSSTLEEWMKGTVLHENAFMWRNMTCTCTYTAHTCVFTTAKIATVAYVHVERSYRSIPSGILTAHTE